MPVSGLVLTLIEDRDARREAVRAIEATREIELGVMEGRRVAAVLDTANDQENRRSWTWLNALRGVQHVDVVFVSCEGDDEVGRAAREVVGDGLDQ